MLRKVLMVAYYTPPLGLSGVMRVTKLCKFLPEFGWQPLLLTVKPVAYYAYDPDLLSDLTAAAVYRTESLDPNRLLEVIRPKRRRLRPALTRTGGKGPRLLNHLLFPDAKIGWLPFAVARGRKVINEQRPAAIFATAPPFTALLVGVRLKAAARVPLVIDFRDPWPTGFEPPPRWQIGALRRLRAKLVRHADLVLAVNEGTARAVGQGVQVLENGFDPTEFAVEPVPLEGFSIVHVGNLWENQAELMAFAQTLALLPDARLYLAGRVDPQTRHRLECLPQVKLLGTLPHSAVCRLMKGANVLLYLGKPLQPVGIKLYEYLGAQRPILVCGTEIDEAGQIVRECGAGLVSELAGPAVVAALERLRTNPEQFTSGSRDRFNRRFQARWLAERLGELTEERPSSDTPGRR